MSTRNQMFGNKLDAATLEGLQSMLEGNNVLVRAFQAVSDWDDSNDEATIVIDAQGACVRASSCQRLARACGIQHPACLALLRMQLMSLALPSPLRRAREGWPRPSRPRSTVERARRRPGGSHHAGG